MSLSAFIPISLFMALNPFWQMMSLMLMHIFGKNVEYLLFFSGIWFPNNPTQVGCSRDGRVPATWCRVLSSLTTSYYSAYDSISGDEPDIVAQVECTQDGRFAQEQCLGEECWCVEKDRGHILEECPGSRGRGKRNAAHSVCLAKRANQLEAYYEFVIRGREKKVCSCFKSQVRYENAFIPK